MRPPKRQGLYDPQHEHDACGVGFLVDIEGRKSAKLVRDAVEVLRNLGHRGASGCEENTGDGAGILLQLPDAFLRKVAGAQGLQLPAVGHYGVAVVFLPTLEGARAAAEALIEKAITQAGQTVLGWRDVPTDNHRLGASAIRSQPIIKQLFVGRGKDVPDEATFERRLYLARRIAENLVRASDDPRLAHDAGAQKELFYICSLSYKTMVLKGMLTADQLASFFPDLSDPAMESALA